MKRLGSPAASASVVEINCRRGRRVPGVKKGKLDEEEGKEACRKVALGLAGTAKAGPSGAALVNPDREANNTPLRACLRPWGCSRPAPMCWSHVVTVHRNGVCVSTSATLISSAVIAAYSLALPLLPLPQRAPRPFPQSCCRSVCLPQILTEHLLRARHYVCHGEKKWFKSKQTNKKGTNTVCYELYVVSPDPCVEVRAPQKVLYLETVLKR